MPLGDLYYPELLACALCVNAPKIFANIWSIFKHMLSPNIQARTIIVSKEETPALIARLAPSHEIPTALHNAGGRCAEMPPSVASRVGYRHLDTATLRSLLIQQPASLGGCREHFTIESDAVGPMRSEVPVWNEPPGFTELTRSLARPSPAGAVTAKTRARAFQNPTRTEDGGLPELRAARAHIAAVRESHRHQAQDPHRVFAVTPPRLPSRVSVGSYTVRPKVRIPASDVEIVPGA